MELNDILRVASKRGASDVHLKVGHPPICRINGNLVPLKVPDPLKPEDLLAISETPEDIWLLVAGGPGTHSVYVPCFGNSRAVTRELRDAS